MAISIVGSNRNIWGNNGQFETDPSTWGFSGGDWVRSRSALAPANGLYSCKLINYGSVDFDAPTIFNPNPRINLASARFSVDPNKKYIATAKVKTPSTAAIAPDACTFKIVYGLDALFVNSIAQTNKTVADAKDAWVTVKFQFNTNGSGFITPPSPGTYMQLDLAIFSSVSGDHIAYLGQLFVDQFEVYEYIDVASDLAFDLPSCVVTDDTGAGDGTITIAAILGVPAYQYSIDGGATWQGSNEFDDLPAGNYTVSLKDTTGYTITQDFVVNLSSVPFTFTTTVTNETVAGAGNGKIVVNVIGATGPYTYSKDGGATYQSSNTFDHLVPGDYTIYVKDSGDLTLGHLVTVLAGTIVFEKIWFSRNHIIHQASAEPGWDELTNVRIYNEVTLNKNDDGVYSSIPFKTDLPPDSDGNVVFYNREAFTGALKAIPPDLNADSIIRLKDRIKLFRNNTAQLQDTETSPPGGTTPSLPHLVLLGGLSKFAWASIDFFTDYLPTNKKFLTWAPVVKPVDKSQEDYLNYFVFNPATVTLQLKIKAFFDDNTNESDIIDSLAGVQYGQLYQIPAGPANTGAALINPAKNLVKYELSLLDQDDSLISEVRTYVLDEVSHPRKRLFMFLNSLGGYEVLRFTGVESNSVIIAKNEVAKFLPYNYNALDGEREMNDVTLRESNSISSGYIKDSLGAAWLDYMKDLLMARKVYEVTDGRRIPLMIQPATYPMKTDQNFEYFLRFTALNAYEDENYTPLSI